ncbi:MAG: dihydroneopterin aldolase [Kiritimatiellae bacterium]|nr:dihydroneopterin aldolase [Kiritimatiellia bacterium]
MDLIRITDLTLDCLIGVYPHEREQRRPLIINLEIQANLQPGTRTDRVEDTLSYEEIHNEVRDLVLHSEYALIEALAEAVADCCLHHPRVHSVRVRMDKPAIFSDVHSAGVELLRGRPTQG